MHYLVSNQELFKYYFNLMHNISLPFYLIIFNIIILHLTSYHYTII